MHLALLSRVVVVVVVVVVHSLEIRQAEVHQLGREEHSTLRLALPWDTVSQGEAQGGNNPRVAVGVRFEEELQVLGSLHK